MEMNTINYGTKETIVIEKTIETINIEVPDYTTKLKTYTDAIANAVETENYTHEVLDNCLMDKIDMIGVYLFNLFKPFKNNTSILGRNIVGDRHFVGSFIIYINNNFLRFSYGNHYTPTNCILDIDLDKEKYMLNNHCSEEVLINCIKEWKYIKTQLNDAIDNELKVHLNDWISETSKSVKTANAILNFEI